MFATRCTTSRRLRACLRVEQLEDRTTPARLVNPTTLTFTDVDGDRVTVQVTRNTGPALALTGSEFTFAASGAGEQLQKVDLNDNGMMFAGADVTITVKKGRTGDGKTNVGFIDADGIDLHSVRIDGDLGRIRVGDYDSSVPALGVLDVASLGRAGLSSQQPGGSLRSSIAGSLGTLRVRGDINAATIGVFGSFDSPGDGGIGRVVVEGSIRGGDTGFDYDTGGVSADGDIGQIHVQGDVAGGADEGSGFLRSRGHIKKVMIGSVRGGMGGDSGVISAAKGIGEVEIGGDLAGGGGDGSGSIGVDSGRQFVRHTPDGRLDEVHIAGSIRSGEGEMSGSIRAERIGSLDVDGSILGTPARPVTILATGAQVAQQRVETRTEYREVEEQVMLPDGRIIVVKKIVPVQVQVVVTVFLRRPGDIDHLHIAGDVVRAEVMANRDGSIGDAFVGGDLRASSLAAGVDRGFDGMFGTDDDRFVFPGPGHPSGRIGRIHVQGQLVGTPEPGDRFGIVARQIDAFFSSTTGDLPLRRGPSNDDMLIGTTGDVRLRELVPTAPAPPAPPGGGGFEP